MAGGHNVIALGMVPAPIDSGNPKRARPHQYSRFDRCGGVRTGSGRPGGKLECRRARIGERRRSV